MRGWWLSKAIGCASRRRERAQHRLPECSSLRFFGKLREHAAGFCPGLAALFSPVREKLSVHRGAGVSNIFFFKGLRGGFCDLVVAWVMVWSFCSTVRCNVWRSERYSKQAEGSL